MVRLCKGEGLTRGLAALSRVLLNLWRDPSLDVGATCTVLIGTAVDLGCRLATYEEYPVKGCLMVKDFNENHLIEIMDFLARDSRELDAGFMLPLQKLAKRRGQELQQIRYLSSLAVQDGLARVFRASAANTMDNERKHAVTKRNEQSKVTHVAVASCNGILRAFSRKRAELDHTMRRWEKLYRAACKLKTTSIASGTGPAATYADARSRSGADMGRAMAQWTVAAGAG